MLSILISERIYIHILYRIFDEWEPRIFPRDIDLVWYMNDFAGNHGQSVIDSLYKEIHLLYLWQNMTSPIE